MTAPMILILAQVDDASGEVLEDTAKHLHEAGALSLQILASLGKKGRPGHVLLIDVGPFYAARCMPSSCAYRRAG